MASSKTFMVVSGVHGWKRVARARNGHAYLRPSEVEWQERVRETWRRSDGKKYMGAVSVDIVAYKVHDITTPDIDNIVKSILDALNGYAWDDDKQVTKLTVRKETKEAAEPEATVVTIEGEVVDDARWPNQDPTRSLWRGEGVMDDQIAEWHAERAAQRCDECRYFRPIDGTRGDGRCLHGKPRTYTRGCDRCDAFSRAYRERTNEAMQAALQPRRWILEARR